MPVILPRAAEDFWLSPDVTEPERLLPHLVPYLADKMQAFPISSLVNNPRMDDPAVLRPIRE